MARLTVYLKDVTHYTLRGRSVKRSTNKIARTPFDFLAGKTCFMEGTPWYLFFCAYFISIFQKQIHYRYRSI